MQLNFAPLLALICLLPAKAAEVTPAMVVALANAEGGRSALQQFFDCGESGHRAYAMVESGSRQWVAIAVRLLRDADGCYSESLHDAIARAMASAPRIILPLVDSTEDLSTRKICIPFLSADVSAVKHIIYLRRLEAALRSVKSPALKHAKEACLAEVQVARAALKNVP